MENWTEIRTAYQVARLRTVSAAAQALGIHRVTVIRHIDVLESVLGEKLFLRNMTGYTPTESGWELMRVAQATEDQFEQLGAQLKAQAQLKAGQLVLTSLPVVAPLIMPALNAFTQRYPDVLLRHIASARTLKLEKGEAHVAVRTSPSPEEPENVVQPLTQFEIGLFASKSYIDRMGAPSSKADLAAHRFVALDDANHANSAKFYLEWLDELAPTATIVFRSTNLSCIEQAIREGVGIGFAPTFVGARLGLVHVVPEETRRGQLNLVTHVDLHRTERVQQLLSVLKEHVPRELKQTTPGRDD